MKFITAIAITLAASFAHAEMGESAYRDENRAVATGAYNKAPKRRAHGENLVPSPSYCSNAGDQVARPVYREVKGQIVLAGFECIQDNRGSN